MALENELEKRLEQCRKIGHQLVFVSEKGQERGSLLISVEKSSSLRSSEQADVLEGIVVLVSPLFRNVQVYLPGDLRIGMSHAPADHIQGDSLLCEQ